MGGFTFRRARVRNTYGRWGGGPGEVSGWKPLGTHFLHEPSAADQPETIDWVEYRHWDPDRNDYGAIHDLRAELPAPEARFANLPILAHCATSSLPAEHREGTEYFSWPAWRKREESDATSEVESCCVNSS